MTEQEKPDLEREISESIEPFAKLPDPEEWLDESIEPRLSTDGAWIAVTNYSEGDIPRWIHCSWLTDDSANARLLEMMPRPLVKRVSTQLKRKPLTAWECWPNPTVNGNYLHVRHEDRRTAVCLAFRAWKRSPR